MTWKDFITKEQEKDYYLKLKSELEKEREQYVIFPDPEKVFNAFKFSPYEQTKVLILGQDPYINPGQAQGLSFSVPNDCTLPPSLKNIFKELKADLNIDRTNGSLEDWARQGVCLLNNTLTVRQGASNSHKDLGWNTFTDNAISYLNEKDSPIVFILWGNFAKSKSVLITNNKHLVLTSTHPSPFSANNGFFGSKPFSKTNNFLVNNNCLPIDW